MNRIFQENGNYYIYFGKFPQLSIKDSYLINNLNYSAVKNEKGYYEYNGNEYYKDESEKWFKFEPIKWRVLENNNGTYLLLSEYLLYSSIFNGGPTTYQKSDIRFYLVEYDQGFYNIAFNEEEKYYIQGNNYLNNDKVWLLSKDYMSITKYGLYNDSLRRAKPTSFALYGKLLKSYLCALPFLDDNYGTSDWWLRTSYPDDNYKAYLVSRDGSVYERDVDYKFYCVRPALYLRIN